MLNKNILLYSISLISVTIASLSVYYSSKYSWLILIAILFLVVLKFSIKRISANQKYAKDN